MNQEQAAKKISENVENIRRLINESTLLADEHALDFSLDGMPYGMGGWYYGKESEGWSESEAREQGEEDEGFWMASSRSC